MPPKRGKKESKRTLYHILGNLDEFVPPTTCHTSLQDFLESPSDEEDPLSDSPANSAAAGGGVSPFGRSVSPMSPSAISADPLVAPRGGGKRGRASEPAEMASSPRTIVIGGATAERKWGGGRKLEEETSDSPMFLTELGMRERVAQRNLESTLYFAEMVGNSKEIGPLREFVDWVDGIGVARHLQDIRHMGQLQQLHALLVDKPFSTRMTKRGPFEKVAKCQALLLLYLCHQTPLEVISTPELFTFLIDLVARFSCSSSDLSTPSSDSPPPTSDTDTIRSPSFFPPPPQLPPAAPKKSHWSALLSKSKTTTTTQPLPPSTTSLTTAQPNTDVESTTDQHVWATVRSWLQNTVGTTATEGIPIHIQDATILTIVLDTLLFVVLGSNRRSVVAAGGNDPSTRLFGEDGGTDGESQLDSQLSASHRLASMSTDSFSESHQGAITKPSALLFVGAGGLEVAHQLLGHLHTQEQEKLMKVAASGKKSKKTTTGDEEKTRRYHIEDEAPELSKLIQLLETVSCCEDLRNISMVEQQPLSRILLKVLGMLPLKEGSTSNNEIFMRRIRVCLNVSSVSPQSVPTDAPHCDQVGEYLASVFLSASSDTTSNDEDEDRSKLEVCSSSVCLMVNLLKRGSNDTFRWSLLNSLQGAFALTASKVAQRYYSQEGDVSMSVTAGYIAVMLGMLSLGDPEARVTVVTALLNGASDSVQSVRHKPMLWVIAILQEFIMFQSTAQILTKNTVVTLTTVVDTLMAENGISVGDGSATPPE